MKRCLAFEEQNLLTYVRYQELTSKSRLNQSEVDQLASTINENGGEKMLKEF
jgi:hypothetical protein